MSQPSTPSAPDPARSYEQEIQIYLRNLGPLLQAEQSARDAYDPTRVAQQQILQQEFGPTQYAQQQQALYQLDPQSQIIRNQLARSVSHDLSLGTHLGTDLENQLNTQIRGAQAARGNSLGSSAGNAEALFKGKAGLDLYQHRQAAAGTFLESPTPIQQIAGIQSVSPDRTNAYTNPNAGFQGQNFALQNYGNQLAASNRPNPWAGALGGAASGASIGASAGGGWGAAIGGIAGGAAGYFCDSRLKSNAVHVGTSPSGVALYEFSYTDDPDQKRYRAAMAQDIQSVFPQAVSVHSSGYLTVDFSRTDIEFKEAV